MPLTKAGYLTAFAVATLVAAINLFMVGWSFWLTTRNGFGINDWMVNTTSPRFALNMVLWTGYAYAIFTLRRVALPLIIAIAVKIIFGLIKLDFAGFQDGFSQSILLTVLLLNFIPFLLLEFTFRAWWKGELA